MTKEITKAYILQEMQDKFALRDLITETFSLSEEVLPVYDIAPHLTSMAAKWTSQSITSIGGKTFFTVPDRQRWHLQRYVVVFMGADAHTVSGVYIQRKKELIAGSFVYLDLTAGQTVSYAIDTPKPVRLDSGDNICINIDGYTSTQDLRLYIDYMMEWLR